MRAYPADAAWEGEGGRPTVAATTFLGGVYVLRVVKAGGGWKFEEVAVAEPGEEEDEYEGGDVPKPTEI